jgi:predicted nucleic acid-binding protein
MNGTEIFVDTNVCIYLLDGNDVLVEMLQGQNLYISIITEMELHAYHGHNSSAIQVLDNFLQSVSIINIEEKVKRYTIEIRKQAKLKLPDSIIAASAISYGMPLITADKSFKKITNLDLILFESI